MSKKLAVASRFVCDRDMLIAEWYEAVGVSRARLYLYLEPDDSPGKRSS
jgi:hypothetical protein